VPLESPSRRPVRAPEGPAFSSFLERDASRERRRRSRRNTLVISLLIHGLAVAALVVYSLWDVDELWGPQVHVKVFAPSKVPPAVLLTPAPKSPLPR
jgi:hypothetical protein